MTKWIYKLKKGSELRRLIEEAETTENLLEILQELKNCYQEILAFYPFEDEYDKYNIQEALDFLEGDDEIIQEEELEEYGFENAEDLIDNRLEEFYNLCDDYRIWVEL